MMYVVRQPDGTLAQIPSWMCSPDAAAMAVTDRPRLALDALRELRSLLDTRLPSFSHTDVGERHGNTCDLLERLEPGPTLTPTMQRALIPMLAALLLEAATNPAEDMADGAATDREAGDEQDRA